MFIKGCDYSMWSNHEEESTNQEESIDNEEFVELSDMSLLEGNKEVKEGEGIYPLTSNKLLNKIREILYQHNQIKKKFYNNNLIKSL